MTTRRGWESSALVRSANSVGGRTFALLTIGIMAAAALSLILTEASRRHGFEDLRTSQLIARAAQLQARWLAASIVG